MVMVDSYERKKHALFKANGNKINNQEYDVTEHQ